ncbi:MAG: hypothetical protein A9183_00700 [Dehalococcoides mccartyi]|uniref:hypothetical protein n=1 Tax=Dehalococcoides mccartyi TaxID=61435 RepID=UPI000804BAE1|nr:hypothetical protein [Dehalococcoides mccartyi]OBW62928.1 MAG: hypothetical protein A9183_00700 [Dehalococcoides mccartyi]
MNKDYEDLRNKAKSFGFNFDVIIQEAQEQIIKAILPEIQGRIESAVKANVPTLQEIVELLANRIPMPKVNIEDVVNQVVARIPTSGAVEEARIIKQVKDDLQDEMLATLNEFKLLVADQLKQIREGNARQIEQMFVQNKDVIIQTINQNITDQLKNLSPAGMSGGNGPMDKYLPFLEKMFGANQAQPEDFLDKMEREMGRYQRLQAIFGGGQPANQPETMFNIAQKALIEGVKIGTRGRTVVVSDPKAFTGPSIGFLNRPKKSPSVDPIVAKL